MIRGIGIDIIEIDRIDQAYKKWGEKFLEKIFTESEISYCLSKTIVSQHLAVRFACKEAFYKAISFIPGFQFSWKKIEITNDSDGKPQIKTFDGKSSELNKYKIHISMSHSLNYATAIAIIEE